MYARMEAVSRLLEWTGVQHRANYEPMLERMTGGVRRRRCAFWRTRWKAWDWVRGRAPGSTPA